MIIGNLLTIITIITNMKQQAMLPKQVRRWVQKIRMPSGQCQACLSDKTTDKDYMLTCSICQSSIHNKHYGREIHESATQSIEGWKCERCRVLTEADSPPAQIESMQCNFCPNKRGILKRVVFNTAETIWLHPECSTWPFPIIFQKNRRGIHYISEYPSKPTGCFWVNLQDQQHASCQICDNSSGYKIKCMYYTCQKYFHSSCAKSNGFIRDLESMHFENCDTYIPPYCQEHLQLRIKDCEVKRNKYRGMGDEGKASHFNQMLQAYHIQRNNMAKSAEKYRAEEEIRLQMQYQTGEKEDLIEEVSFDSLSNSYHSNHPPDFIMQIFDNEYPSARPRVAPQQLQQQQEQQEQMENEQETARAGLGTKEGELRQVCEPKDISGSGSLQRMIGLQKPKYKASPRESDNEGSDYNMNLEDIDQEDD